MDSNFNEVLKRILNDIRVELKEEFDLNFERQAFFSESWQRRKSPIRPGGSTLVDSGSLKRSIISEIKGNSIIFRSTSPYASIHNDGGEIRVTEKMKRFFRAKFYETQGGFSRTKHNSTKRTLSDGGFFRWTEKMSLSTKSEFWRTLALMKVGAIIRIPRRKIIGYSPEIEAAIREIIEDSITEYFKIDFRIK